jgi:hypothetical protein
LGITIGLVEWHRGRVVGIRGFLVATLSMARGAVSIC